MISARIFFPNAAMLKTVIEDHEYVAVLFTGLCGPSEEEEDECTNTIEKLEQIDTHLDQVKKVHWKLYTAPRC